MTPTQEYITGLVTNLLAIIVGAWLCYVASASDRVGHVHTQRVRYRILTMALVAYLIVAVSDGAAVRSHWDQSGEAKYVLTFALLAVVASLGAFVVPFAFVRLYRNPVYVAYKKDGCHRLTEEIREGRLQWYDSSSGKPVDRTRTVLWDD
jgi:DMSO reductase anchor subunit